MKTQTFTKINTLYKRYKNLGKVELPNKQWIKFQNKIILGDFSDDFMAYIKDLKYDCFSKIDGTNSKIIYFPSTGECFCGGKTDNADIVGTGQKAMLDQVIERIKPILGELFPKESAKFTPVLNERNQVQYYWPEVMNLPEGSLPVRGDAVDNITGNGTYMVTLEEVPVYIYGEFYGKGIQKCGGNYGDEKRFTVFDICQQGWYVPITMLYDYCEKLGLEVAPYLGQMTIDEAEKMVVHGFKTRVPNVANPEFIEEGIVARPIVPIKDPRGNRIIVKIKHCDYAELNAVIDELGTIEYDKFHKWYMENRNEIERVK
jgi:hypothetical protein